MNSKSLESDRVFNLFSYEFSRRKSKKKKKSEEISFPSFLPENDFQEKQYFNIDVLVIYKIVNKSKV